MQLSRYSEAADAFASYLTVFPGVLDAFINERRADALAADGDYSGALVAYINAVQSPRLPTNFSLELKLAQTYSILGDYVTADVVYTDIFSRTSSDYIKAQVDYARGQIFTALGQAEQATSSYVDTVFNYPQAYYSYLALIELVNSGYQVSEFQRGLVDYYVGKNAFQNNDYETAMEKYSVALAAFDRYLSLGPSDASTALYYKGIILRDQDDSVSAIALWDLVIQGDQTSPVLDSAWEQKAYTQWAYQEITQPVRRPS